VIVAIKMIARRLASGECCVNLRAVHNEDVGPAVIVVIENRDTRARGLDDELLGGHAAKNILHGEAGFLGDIREVDYGSGHHHRGGLDLLTLKRHSQGKYQTNVSDPRVN
jgi:hypothetical protein